MYVLRSIKSDSSTQTDLYGDYLSVWKFMKTQLMTVFTLLSESIPAAMFLGLLPEPQLVGHICNQFSKKYFIPEKRLLSKDAYPPGFPFHLNLYKPTFFRKMVNIRVYSYQVVQSSKSTIFLNLSTPMTLVRDKNML